MKIKKSNNSSFVILILEVSNFRNIGHSTFGRSKFTPPRKNCNKQVMLLYIIRFKQVKFSYLSSIQHVILIIVFHATSEGNAQSKSAITHELHILFCPTNMGKITLRA